MTFANTLSLRFLILSGALALGACNQPVPGQLANGAMGAAAGAGAKGAAAKTQKTATGQQATNAMPKGQSAMNEAGASASAGSKNGGDMAANGGDMSGAAPAGQAKGASGAAGAGPAAPAMNAKAVPACEGKADEYACDDRTLYHCVMGAYTGSPKSCKTAAQCMAGLTTGQCGECDPGTFMCDDVQLQRCDDTGMYVMEAECASAKLCKAEMGICDTQICHDGEYQCMGDQLQTCKRDFTDWENSGRACMPGLCSAKAQGCLECMPDSPATCEDERSLKTCTPEGMLDRKSCGADTPFCADGKCVQCNKAEDCGQAKNDCGTMTCNKGMCAAGDPKPQGTACSSNGGKLCDFTGNCVTCVTDLDCKDSTKRCFLGMQCVTKDAITATPLLDSWSVTVSPGFSAIVQDNGLPVMGDQNGTLNASNVIDATFLLSISGYSACGIIQTAPRDGSSITLNFSDKTMVDTNGFPTDGCRTGITLTAKGSP